MDVILSYLNRPYHWGGDDPSGIDCSGLVIEGLKAVGFLTENDDYTADGLYQLFAGFAERCKPHHRFNITHLISPKRSALLFFRNNQKRIFHCAIALNQYYQNYQIGAIGGDSTTNSTKLAYQQNAYVKIRPIPSNRELSCFSIFG